MAVWTSELSDDAVNKSVSSMSIWNAMLSTASRYASLIHTWPRIPSGLKSSSYSGDFARNDVLLNRDYYVSCFYWLDARERSYYFFDFETLAEGIPLFEWVNTQGDGVSMFRGFDALPDGLQKRFRGRQDNLSAESVNIQDFFWDPNIPDDDNELISYLERVNHCIIWFREIIPTQAYKFLASLYSKLRKKESIHTSPAYLNMMWELVVAASHSADFSGLWEKIEEIEALIDIHHSTICSAISENPFPEFPADDVIFIYRTNFINPVINLAYFLSRRWEHERAESYIEMVRVISSRFAFAHRTFDTYMFGVLNAYNQWEYSNPEINSDLWSASVDWLPMLRRIYDKIWDLRPYTRAKLEYDTLRLLWTVKQFKTPSTNDLVSVMKELGNLMKIKDTNTSIQQLLFHIQILIYIASQRFISTIDLEDQNLGNDDLKYLMDESNRMDLHSFDIESALAQDNAWFFLWWLVELFCYRVENLWEKGTFSDGTRRTQVLHMMLDIYWIAAWKRNVSKKNIELFSRRTYYKEFIDSSAKLLQSIEGVDLGDKCGVLDEISRLFGLREKLSEAYYQSMIEKEFLGKQKMTSLSVSRLHQEADHDDIEYDAFVIVQWDYSTEYIVHDFMQAWGKYRLRVSWTNLDSITSIEQNIKTLLPLIQREISERNINKVHTDLGVEGRADSSSTTWTRNEMSINFAKILPHLWQLGIPRSSKMFFEWLLDIWWVAVRIPFAQLSLDIIENATWMPVIILMEENETSISIVKVGVLDNGDELYAVRFGIKDVDQIYNLPPYWSLALIKKTKCGTLQYQTPVQSEEDRSKNGIAEIYNKQLQALMAKFGCTSVEESLQSSLNATILYSDSIGTLFDGWILVESIPHNPNIEHNTKPTQTRRHTVVIQVKGENNSSVQLLATFSRDGDQEIIYISSMISTIKTDIYYISKWFSGFIIKYYKSLGLEDVELAHKIAAWERNWTYVKDKTALPILRWDNVNRRFSGASFSYLI